MSDSVDQHSLRIERRDACAADLKSLAKEVKEKAAVAAEKAPGSDHGELCVHVNELTTELDGLAEVILFGGVAHYNHQIAPIISKLQRLGLSLLDNDRVRKLELAFAKAAESGWPDRRR